jgi:AcrR family transcriptional regulator
MSESLEKERWRAARSDMYRALILDLAEEVFAESGFEAAAVRDVAARGSMSLATLYGHFAGKDALYRAVHGRRLAELLRVTIRPAPAAVDALDRLLGALEWHVAFHVAHPAYLRMHLREGNTWGFVEGLRTPEQVAAWTAGQQTMAAAFADGQASGLFVDEDTAWMSRTTNVLTQMALARWVEQGMERGVDDVARELRRQFVRSFCRLERMAELLARVDARPPIEGA